MRNVISTQLEMLVKKALPAVGLLAIALSACTPAPREEGKTEIAKEEIRMSAIDVNKYPVTKTVCDPWGGDPDPRSNQGLSAELWWLAKGTPIQNNVGNMIAKGVKSDRKLFFSQLNVPTRLFQLGFANEMGETVKDDAGGTLIEYFALRFKSVLKLAPDQRAGLYEFAILSDDGAIMNFRDVDGVYRPNVSNDGDHGTKLGCGSAPIAMDAETEVPMNLDYYQGPRYHISLIVLMREFKPRASDKNGKDPSCGVVGNSTWFDPDKQSKPQKAYNDLLARDWRPLSKDNFALPNSAMFNPCKDGVAPVISNFQVLERFNDGFIVSWNTDIPATSQVVATDGAGAQTISVSDNILRTSHSVRIQGLKAMTNYRVQGVSISDTYGRTISTAVDSITDI